jgi:hypothetical protein
MVMGCGPSGRSFVDFGRERVMRENQYAILRWHEDTSEPPTIYVICDTQHETLALQEQLERLFRPETSEND